MINRTHWMPCICETMLSKSASLYVFAFWSVKEYLLIVWPRRVICFIPCDARFFACVRISSGEREISGPRTYGTMQYVQNLLQPLIALMKACAGICLSSLSCIDSKSSSCDAVFGSGDCRIFGVILTVWLLFFKFCWMSSGICGICVGPATMFTAGCWSSFSPSR